MKQLWSGVKIVEKIIALYNSNTNRKIALYNLTSTADDIIVKRWNIERLTYQTVSVLHHFNRNMPMITV